jgi:hypothetical protein
MLLGGLDEGPPFPSWSERRWARRRDSRRSTDARTRSQPGRGPEPGRRPGNDIAESLALNTRQLELNTRQKELFDEVVNKLEEKLSGGSIDAVLRAVANEPLDRGAIEELAGTGELADDLEQLHYSLTAEQRAKLQQLTAG